MPAPDVSDVLRDLERAQKRALDNFEAVLLQFEFSVPSYSQPLSRWTFLLEHLLACTSDLSATMNLRRARLNDIRRNAIACKPNDDVFLAQVQVMQTKCCYLMRELRKRCTECEIEISQLSSRGHPVFGENISPSQIDIHV